MSCRNLSLSLILTFLSFPLLAVDTELSISHPYVRLAPPNATTTGAFMRIENTSKTPRLLLSAESPVAKTVELHTHVNENGMMKMRQVSSIAIDAGGQTELKPGSYHVMLIDMKQTLKEGDVVPLTLHFDDGRTKSVQAPVQKLPTTMPAAHGGMKH